MEKADLDRYVDVFFYYQEVTSTQVLGVGIDDEPSDIADGVGGT